MCIVHIVRTRHIRNINGTSYIPCDSNRMLFLIKSPAIIQLCPPQEVCKTFKTSFFLAAFPSPRDIFVVQSEPQDLKY